MQRIPTRAGGLYRYTGFTDVRADVLDHFRKTHRKVLKFPERKELFLMNMADTRENEHTLVPNTKEKSDLWKTLVYVSKRQIDEMILMLLYVNSSIPLSNMQ